MSVELGGWQYFGLGMRFVAELDRIGEFQAAETEKGKNVRGDEQLFHGRWCAYRALSNDRTVTIVMFDHRANLRPATWFTMARPFAFLAATLGVDQQSIVLEFGEPIDLRYGVAVIDGETSRGKIEQLYQLWQKRNSGSEKVTQSAQTGDTHVRSHKRAD